MTTLEIAAQKQLPEHWHEDVKKFYIERLFSFPENTWFTPSNAIGDHQDYDICRFLHGEAHLICMKITPIYVNGNWKGNKVYFFYNKELQYK